MNADKHGGNLAADKMPLNMLTRQVIGCAMRVSSSLGCGFLEKVYENALIYEIRKHDLPCAQQVPLKVRYDGVVVGDYTADLLVDERLLLELKAATAIDKIHMAQTLNYLRATDLRIGLTLNFGKPKLEVKRVVHGL